MKYFSELLNKNFDTVEELQAAETEKNAEIAKSTNEKKAMAKKVEETEAELKKAYDNYELAKQEASKIAEEANKKIADLLNPAKEAIYDAQQNRYNAISEFSDKYGKYSVIYTGDRAFQEMQRMKKHMDNILTQIWF